MKLLWISTRARLTASANSNSPRRESTQPGIRSHDVDVIEGEAYPGSDRPNPEVTWCNHIGLFAFLLCCLVSLLIPTSVRAQSKVTITGVAINTDSIKVRFLPVTGAKDYRIYDKTVPTTVKYAGVWHILSPYPYLFQTDSNGMPLIPDALVVRIGTEIEPTEADVPALEIEMNGLAAGSPHTLVVEAVDALGPVAACCMYDVNNKPIQTCPPGCPGCKLGMNSCCTKDGKTSTNGQGAATNNPKAIASTSFTVTPTGLPSVPSSPLASQVFFDTFDSGVITPVGVVDAVGGNERFSLVTPAATWEIRTELADTLDTTVMVANKHFMDVLFDCGTPGTNNPLHVGHGVLSLSPVQTVNFGGGQILHLTAEIDGHLGPSRRYADFRLTPYNDPYITFDGDFGQINNTDTDVMVQFFDGGVTVDEDNGPTPGDPNKLPLHTRVVGAAGQAIFSDCYRPRLSLQTNGYQSGRGLDNRSRFDAFISSTHFAIYEDGIKITEHDFAKPIPFQAAKVYYSHYHYHSALEIEELADSNPWETYWINTFPYSDERHWDNLGYEVLPGNINWSALGNLVQPPAFQPLSAITNSATFVGTDSTTHGTWIGKYGADGYNVVSDALNWPSYAKVTDIGDSEWTYSPSTTNVGDLQKISVPGDRLGAMLFAFPTFSLDVNLTDGLAHQVAIYSRDVISIGSQTIQIIDANSGAVLDTETVSSFTNGKYLIWNISGHVRIVLTNVNPTNRAAMDGIFFDTVPVTTGPPTPTNVTLSPASVVGGTPSTGTVTLNGPALTGGLTVNLSAGSPASVPASVTVAAGTTSATFTVSTSAVTATATPSITAAANGFAASGTLTVTAPARVPTGLTLSPASVIGGTSSTGTVTINGPAPTGGLAVNLSTASPASVPASVTVAAGSTTATFTVTTTAVTAAATPSITASANGTTTSGTLTVTAAARVPTGVTFSPTSVVGGASSTGTVTISGAAPTGGLTVNLSTVNPAAVPASVTVAAGSTTATFTVTTIAVTAAATPSIAATANGTSASGTVTVTAAARVPTGVTFSPASVVGGTSSTGTVTISGAAPSGGLTVNLSTASPASVPASVTVAAGSTTAAFTVTTTAVTASATPSIKASANGTSASGMLNVTAAARVPISVTFSPSSVIGGTTSIGTVTISGVAPTGGLVVNLNAGSPASVPVSVAIPAGTTAATFTVSTSAVTTVVTSSIKATGNGTTVSGTLTITPGHTLPPIFTSAAIALPSSITLGSITSLKVTITDIGGALPNSLVDVEIYNSAGTQVQQWFVGQGFTTGQTFSNTYNWKPTSTGTYTVKIGVFGANWTPMYHWNNGATTITVK